MFMLPCRYKNLLAPREAHNCFPSQPDDVEGQGGVLRCPSRNVEERGFQIARRSYFPLGRRAPRSNTALYPRAMLSLRCAVRQQPDTIPTRTPRGKTTIPDHRSAQFFVVSLTRCAHACVLFVGFLNVLRARGDNHSSPASVYATGLSGIVSASAIVSCLAAARHSPT